MYDYHSHTAFSDDCQVPMEEMIENAIKLKIKELAITDHFDPGYPDGEFPFALDFPNYHESLLRAEKKYKEQIKIVKGLEIGIMEGQFKEANDAISAFPYDFIIGSFHCLHEIELHTLDISTVDPVEMGHQFYDYIYECLLTYDNYDVLGHLTLIDRYIGKPALDYSPYMDKIEEILRLAISKEKGLEINTSSFKYKTDLWLPRKEVLRRYRELGGEILTIGSDSHHPDHLIHHFKDAISMVEDVGFTHFATFSNRTPTFHSFKEL